METTKIMQEIISANKNSSMRYFAIRGDDTEVSVGMELEASHDWDYENDCQSDRYLSGTCGTKIDLIWFDGGDEDLENLEKALKYHNNNYSYKYTSIIGGYNADYGADENEAIIENAEVICIVK